MKKLIFGTNMVGLVLIIWNNDLYTFSMGIATIMLMSLVTLVLLDDKK